jgi:hypothetical protein
MKYAVARLPRNMNKIVIGSLNGRKLLGATTRRMFWIPVNMGTESNLKVPKNVKTSAYWIPEKIQTTAVSIDVNCTGMKGIIKKPSIAQKKVQCLEMT